MQHSDSRGVPVSQLFSGTSRIDITPAVPISMGGYGQRAGQKSRAVNDRLFAKALYLANESARFLMITTDLICIPNGLAREAAQEIVRTLRIGDEQICITASHTHSGPEIMEFLTRTAEVEEYLECLGRSLVTVARGAQSRTRSPAGSRRVSGGRISSSIGAPGAIPIGSMIVPLP